MTKLIIISSIAARNIRKWPNNPRILTIIIFLTVTMLWCVLPIRAFLCDVGIAISPWLFPFVSADLYVQVAIILCSVFLFPMLRSLMSLLLMLLSDLADCCGQRGKFFIFLLQAQFLLFLL